MTEDVPGFGSYTVRTDRLQVVATPDGRAWIILPHDDRPAVDQCPCCNRPLLSARAAMLVANAVYPLPEERKPT